MPRRPRLQGPGYTVHVVGRCSDRGCRFTTPDDFRPLLAHRGGMARTCGVTLSACTLMADHACVEHDRHAPGAPDPLTASHLVLAPTVKKPD